MTPDPPPPALLRRMAAVAYDALLLCGVLFFAGLPLPALPEAARNSIWGQISIQIYLVMVCFLFFGWFWTHGGQTLGMRAWRLRLVGPGGSPVSWRHAAVRFLGAALSWAPLGAGFWWSLVDPEKLTWHDRLSGTRLVRTAG